MKLSEIYSFLDKLSPFEKQAHWDNSGILLGDLDDEINTIYLSLDIDANLLKEADENSLFIVHHPLIFKPLKELSTRKYPRAFIKEMIKKNISLIALHTNYDLSHLNSYFTREILGFKDFKQEEYLIYVDINTDFKNLCNHIKKKLNLDLLRVSFCGKEKIKRLAICTGSGGDLIPFVNADCFISGDFKYHQALEALSNDLSLIDIGHFESECCFAQALAKDLQNLSLKVIIKVSKNPFQIF
ncbi:Nif3-like dinuclear metal center hexameric protein [Campylobacter sp. 2018MI35]|uniref:Nif3-like dinuclear metal center hexameric protein n=1 Tax=unclassified Campylobacter TaxID=2593542 RepID=UPI0019037F3A|nr:MULTISPECIES: Nif3-like dinuclear metal center hexameric protein [unclassified Campylobacter]MBK1972380.1 Nif3-like dinuclear metal center hexameric protein [Campylobacter sp. TTU_617]MBK1992332.1 Nif3-like dinuclear metal center hexameric protein [Campylobacter sp. 2018MI34]